MNQAFMDNWTTQVNQSERLVWRGRHLSTEFVLQLDQDIWKIKIHEGRIESATGGPFVMTNWEFAIQTSGQAWSKFCEKLPPPEFHDVMAMLKLKHLKLLGNLYPLMSHLLYFKDILALMREISKHD